MDGSGLRRVSSTETGPQRHKCSNVWRWSIGPEGRQQSAGEEGPCPEPPAAGRVAAAAHAAERRWCRNIHPNKMLHLHTINAHRIQDDLARSSGRSHPQKQASSVDDSGRIHTQKQALTIHCSAPVNLYQDVLVHILELKNRQAYFRTRRCP